MVECRGSRPAETRRFGLTARSHLFVLLNQTVTQVNKSIHGWESFECRTFESYSEYKLDDIGW
jgi:hypothetical protein